MAGEEQDDIAEAKKVLRGENKSLEEARALAKKLQKHKEFHLAWQILARARRDRAVKDDHNLRLKLGQQQAVCTYKDPDLPTESRLARALEILKDVDDLSRTTNQETLGIAGAIHKYQWQWDGQRDNLELSKYYYLRGYQQSYFLADGDAIKQPNDDYDNGYTGINAAFVLDLLASLEEDEIEETKGRISPTVPKEQPKAALERRRQAREIRERLVAVLPSLPGLPKRGWLSEEYWFLATVAEAHFGLGNEKETIEWLNKAKELAKQKDAEGPKVPDWELESTARQLVALAKIRDPKPGPRAISDVLTQGLGIVSEAVDSAVRGKVGLALSGGGFRASLFHIGVLARLAELDMLRHVEVLSCVSGGSIIGAYYYVALRELLESKVDADIKAEHYVAIVEGIAKEFLEGIQRNLRTQVLAEWKTVWRIFSEEGFSQSERLAELYAELLFTARAVGTKAAKVGEESALAQAAEKTPIASEKDVALQDIKIEPKGVGENFNPRLHNWRRKAKVPTLILNATTLNSCHNWQFTASWMGESPALIDIDVDGNDRLRRMYHKDAPEKYRNNPVTLGRAVAASACVPGLFDPITLADLYPDYTVRLVDGGVFDNQGAAGLVEQDCTVLLVSDASGQTDCEGEPDVSRLGVLSRSNNILQARVRVAQYHDQLHRRRSGVLRGLMFLHLRKDLDVDPVNWYDCPDPIEGTEEARPIERRGKLTTYGVRKDVQEKVAALRTDLDAFSDLEAYCLMMSGYLMAASDFTRGVPSLRAEKETPGKWPFLAVKDWMTTPGQGPAERQLLLDLGRYVGMKYWRMSTRLRLSTMLGVAVALVLVVWLLWATWPRIVCLAGWVVLALAGVAAVSLLGALAVTICPSYVSMVRRIREWMRRFGFGVACLFISPFACLYLKLFNGRFLKRGEIKPASAKAPAKSPPAATQNVTPS